MENEQSQNAGDGSQLIQVGGNLNIGITEQRAREIFVELIQQSLEPFYEKAKETAKKRVKKFEESLLPKMKAIDGMLEAFAEPRFQLLLTESQRSAACIDIDKEDTYDLLSELLIHRVKKGENKNVYAAVNRAVKIIDEISDDSLLCITLDHFVYFSTNHTTLNENLNALNSMLGNLLYRALPTDNEWIENLEMVGAIKIHQNYHINKIEKIYTAMYQNHIDIGIEINSENHNNAKEILMKCGLNPFSTLVESDFNEGYLKLPISNIDKLNNLIIIHSYEIDGKQIHDQNPLTEDQKQAFKVIYSTLYSTNENLKNENIIKFMQEWDSRPNLKIFKSWWDNLTTPFELTPVGRVLAHSNAQRCDKDIPDIY